MYKKKPLSLYIHIPFCVKKCNYCAFNSVCAGEEEKNKYVDALIHEIKNRGREFSGGREVQSIYIGGGTPSVLKDGAISEILSTVYKNFVVSRTAEITIEVNPSSLTPLKAKEYKNSGVTRVSMGLQAKQDHHLKTLGRLHTAENFETAVKVLKMVGFENISGDLILGIPNQTEDEVSDSITFMARLGLKHISIYMLEIEEGTNFKKLLDAGLITFPNDSEVIKLYNRANRELISHEYNRYEISNFSKVGFESKHNQVYWDRGEYLGFGTGAHSYLNGYRFANIASVSEYVNRINKNEIPLEYKDEITEEEKTEENIMLSLRTVKGLNLSSLNEETKRAKIPVIKDLIKDGYLVLNPITNYLSATDKGFMVLNRIIEMII